MNGDSPRLCLARFIVGRRCADEKTPSGAMTWREKWERQFGRGESFSEYCARKEREKKARQPMTDTPRARNTDPETSHEAAAAIKESGELGRQQRFALDLVRRFPNCTLSELAQRAAENDSEPWQAHRHRLGRRLPELRPVYAVNGEPRKCSVTGRRAMTWMAKEGKYEQQKLC